MQLGVGATCIFACVHHVGCLLRQYPWPLAMQFGAQKKGVWCNLSGKKVPTCGFLVKKEGVWGDLSGKGANLWNFSEKGRCVT